MTQPPILRQGTLSAVAVSLLSLLLGCGGQGRVAVHGEVTLDGQPLAEGTIKLVPGRSVAGPAVATEVVAGHYEFGSRDGPVPGDYAVEIYAAQPLPPGLDDPDEYIRLGGPHGKVRPPPNGVDAQFNAQTTLKRTISHEGDTRFDFQVTSIPQRR